MGEGLKKYNLVLEKDLNKINIDKLKKLDETQLRRNIIIPLLNYIEAQNVVDMHGSSEEGIDIYFETFDIFGEKLRWGVQVKTVDLILSAQPSNKNIITILNQIQMAFSKRIKIITSDRSGEVYIDGFYVITSGRIKAPAIRYIYNNIYNNRNQHNNIHIIDGNRLIEIIKNKDSLKKREVKYPIGSPKVLWDTEEELK